MAIAGRRRSICRYALRLIILAILLVGVAVQLVTARTTEERPQSSGTGFVVSRHGHVLTNHHVVAECPSVRIMINGELKETAVVGIDKENDLAILKLSKPNSSVARFRKGRTIRSGDNIVVVGFPYHSLLASEAHVTTGAVSALAGLRNDTRFIQIAAPVQPGNSGGPVLDKSGHVVGVVESKLNALAMALITGDIPQNVNFAIKDAIAKSFLESHGVLYEMAASEKQLEPAEIGEVAKQFTLLIECYSETLEAMKQRIEAERRALAEITREEEATREQARIFEQEERLRLAQEIEAERRAAEQEAYQRKLELAEKEAAEMHAASQRVIRFHHEERAREAIEEARTKGRETRAQAALKQEEAVRFAKEEARRRALTAEPHVLEAARRKGREAHALPSLSEELKRAVEEEFKQVRQFQPVAPLEPLKTAKISPFWARVEAIIMSNWESPFTLPSVQSYSVTVQFRFFRNGTVNDVAIKETSGNTYFDQSAQRAVLKPRAFPSFPVEMSEPYQDVEMVFRTATKLKPEANTLGQRPIPKRSESKVTGSEHLSPSPTATTSTSAFNLAYNHYLTGKYELAVVGFQRFVKEFPGTSLTPNAYYWLGESYYQQKDYMRAMQAFEYVAAEFPATEKMPGALFKLGLAAGETGDLAKLKKHLKRVIEEFPISDEAKLAKMRLAER